MTNKKRGQGGFNVPHGHCQGPRTGVKITASRLGDMTGPLVAKLSTVEPGAFARDSFED